MSLILEALKKLDREKQAPDRGLLVVGPVAWPSARDGRPGVGTVAAIVLVLSGIGAAAWLFGGRPSSVVPREMAPRDVTRREAAAVPALPPAGGPTAASKAVRGPGLQDVAASQRGAVAARAPLAEPVPEAGNEATTPRVAAVKEPEPAPPAGARIKEPKLAAGVFQLQAISAQDGHAVAILNDRLVREGDSFDGVKVIRIGADEVEVEVAGRRRVVKF